MDDFVALLDAIYFMKEMKDLQLNDLLKECLCYYRDEFMYDYMENPQDDAMTDNATNSNDSFMKTPIITPTTIETSKLFITDYFFWAMQEVLLNELFEYSRYSYAHQNDCNVHALSNEDMEQYFILAGTYGEKYRFTEDENPYIIDAQKKIEQIFGRFYTVEGRLHGTTHPRRNYQSHLTVFISAESEAPTACGLCFALLDVYKFFRDGVWVLREILGEDGNRVYVYENQINQNQPLQEAA